MSMFGSTYRCEQLFSLMKGNKPPIRSRITDVHLGSVLKLITANKISPEVGKMSKTGIPETFGLYRQMGNHQYGHYTANLKTAYGSKAEYAEQELV
ncbi:GTF2IRD2B [Cordylochernes scorpioides]|uniref:GTF2IRD2B n=1 Tax=Cordylochernes scorpioides TaxID=51811 RepID=A0ABY6LL14_9ARAC|nr:GTF2IRD2B [Cordylochernes scorpioides]